MPALTKHISCVAHWCDLMLGTTNDYTSVNLAHFSPFFSSHQFNCLYYYYQPIKVEVHEQ